MWCGEDGWGYFTAVIDSCCRTILRSTFTSRCHTPDVIVALQAAGGTAFPGLEHLDAIDREAATRVVLRHDNSTQFTAERYVTTARTLGVKCSRTAYRHPDGNAFIERVYKTYKEEWAAQRLREPRRGPRRDRGLGRGLQPGRDRTCRSPIGPRPKPAQRSSHTQSSSLTVNRDWGHYEWSIGRGNASSLSRPPPPSEDARYWRGVP